MSISVNKDGKKLFGENNVVYFKSLCATYKIHYKVYRGTNVYTDETKDVVADHNTFTLSGSASQTRYLDLEFFDENGDKFLPYNVEFMSNILPTNNGSSIYTTLSDGTIRMIIKKQFISTPGALTDGIAFTFDDVTEPIDSRKVTIVFTIE